MYKRIMWFGILIIAAVSFIFIVGGFINAMQFTIGGRNTSQQTTLEASASNGIASNGENAKVNRNPNDLHVLIMGDSIAKGTGDEKIKGIGGYLPEFLKNQTPKNIIVDNGGIDGYKSTDLLSQINAGVFDKGIENSDFIVISIGGNDVREIQSLKDVAKEEAFNEKQVVFLTSLKEVVKKIRDINKDAILVFIGLYDPYGNQGAADNARLISNWNYNAQLIVDADVKGVFVPTYEMFKFNLDRFISNDKLHPNSMGYQTISYLISKIVENADFLVK